VCWPNNIARWLSLAPQGNRKSEGEKATPKIRREFNSELRLRAVNQFAAEMDHFSECILNNQQPRTPGEMGLADMRIITAIHEAARSNRTVSLNR
jgi:predicted dehydrogenase